MKIITLSICLFFISISAIANKTPSLKELEDLVEPFLGNYALIEQVENENSTAACLDSLVIKKHIYGPNQDQLQLITKCTMNDNKSEYDSFSHLHLNKGLTSTIEDCPSAGPPIPFCSVVSQFNHNISEFDLMSETQVEQRSHNPFSTVLSTQTKESVFIRRLPNGNLYYESLKERTEQKLFSHKTLYSIQRSGCIYTPIR